MEYSTSGPLSVGTGFYRGTKVGNSLEKAHPLEGLGTYSAWIFTSYHTGSAQDDQIT